MQWVYAHSTANHKNGLCTIMSFQIYEGLLSYQWLLTRYTIWVHGVHVDIFVILGFDISHDTPCGCMVYMWTFL